MNAQPNCLAILFVPLFAIALAGCTTDVTHDPEMQGGYHAGQELRLRVDAYVYKFDKVAHPAETGAQTEVLPELSPDDQAARSKWESENHCKLLAFLPAGTVLKVMRIDYIATPDTASLVPRAIIKRGPAFRGEIALNGLSTYVGGPEYPYRHYPDPKLVELLPSQ